MRKVTIILAVLFFLAGNSAIFADNNGAGPSKTVAISGKVIDKSNSETLAGALIRIEGTDIETYSDFDGNFTIKGILPDTYKIKCSMISYSDREEEIEIDQATETIEIHLESISADKSAR